MVYSRRQRKDRTPKIKLDIDPCKLECACEEDIQLLAILALTALNAGRDDGEEDDDDGSVVIEVMCPYGVKPGQSIDVKLPAELGGATIQAVVPEGVGPGATFDVHPQTSEPTRRRRAKKREQLMASETKDR